MAGSLLSPLAIVSYCVLAFICGSYLALRLVKSSPFASFLSFNFWKKERLPVPASLAQSSSSSKASSSRSWTRRIANRYSGWTSRLSTRVGLLFPPWRWFPYQRIELLPVTTLTGPRAKVKTLKDKALVDVGNDVRSPSFGIFPGSSNVSACPTPEMPHHRLASPIPRLPITPSLTAGSTVSRVSIDSLPPPPTTPPMVLDPFSPFSSPRQFKGKDPELFDLSAQHFPHFQTHSSGLIYPHNRPRTPSPTFNNPYFLSTSPTNSFRAHRRTKSLGGVTVKKIPAPSPRLLGNGFGTFIPGSFGAPMLGKKDKVGVAELLIDLRDSNEEVEMIALPASTAVQNDAPFTLIDLEEGEVLKPATYDSPKTLNESSYPTIELQGDFLLASPRSLRDDMEMEMGEGESKEDELLLDASRQLWTNEESLTGNFKHNECLEGVMDAHSQDTVLLKGDKQVLASPRPEEGSVDLFDNPFRDPEDPDSQDLLCAMSGRGLNVLDSHHPSSPPSLLLSVSSGHSPFLLTKEAAFDTVLDHETESAADILYELSLLGSPSSDPSCPYEESGIVVQAEDLEDHIEAEGDNMEAALDPNELPLPFGPVVPQVPVMDLEPDRDLVNDLDDMVSEVADSEELHCPPTMVEIVAVAAPDGLTALPTTMMDVDELPSSSAIISAVEPEFPDPDLPDLSSLPLELDPLHVESFLRAMVQAVQSQTVRSEDALVERKANTSISHIPTPPDSPPSLPLSMSMQEENIMADEPIEEEPEVSLPPAWSMRASEAPRLSIVPTPITSALGPKNGGSSEELVTPIPDEDPKDEVPSAQANENSSQSPESFPGSLPVSESVKGEPKADIASDSPHVTNSPEISKLTRARATSVSFASTVTSLVRRKRPSPLDIALAMQMRPGLGAGADPAWMVRFLMAAFGWFVVVVSGNVDGL